MKKLILAAAILAVGSTAMAQTTVANIAAVRALVLPQTDVIISGTVVVISPEGAVQPTRNQFLIADGSGADGKTGILIDDSAEILTGEAAVGDTYTNLRGSLLDFNGLLEFVPLATGAPTFVANGAPSSPFITPTVITVATVFEDVESEVVRVNGADIAETGVFAANTTYALTAPAGISAGINKLRFQASSSSTAVGVAIPSGTFDVIGEARPFTVDFQVCPRFAADIIVAAPTAASTWDLYN
ncbi:hypothetical protein BH09SUM1_BH09SUM1_01560 [soil metagenome]